MKKLTLFFCFVFIFSAQLINAQTPRLWGMTVGEFPYDSGSGMIFQANGSGAYDSVYSFKYLTGNPFPESPSGFTYTSNGKLYGTAYDGGAFGYGVIFSFDPETNIYTDVYDFDSINGSYPVGNLVEASNGLLYGVAEGGGPIDTVGTYDFQNFGVIFSFNPITNTYKDVFSYAFDTSSLSLSEPDFGGLTLGTNGLLYGTSEISEIFSFNPLTNTYNDLYDGIYNLYTDFDIEYPSNNLTQGKDGNLYGVSYLAGGEEPNIFKFDLTVDTFAILYFINNNTNNEFSNLTLGGDGKLYGLSSIGGSDTSQNNGYAGYGYLFSFDPTDSVFTDLYDFTGSVGVFPVGNLLLASDGKFYGTTGEDTSLIGNGYIFSFDPSTSIVTAIHKFDTSAKITIGDLVELDFPYDVWPGDANNDLVVNNYDLLPIGLYYGNTGTARNTTNNTWAAQACTDWDSLQSNGMNRKFVDCNGDGVINADDTMAVSLNYGLTHHYNSPRSSTRSTQGVVSLSIVPDSTSYHAGSRVHAQVLLGTSVSPASNIYGLAYTIIFNTSIIQPGTLSFNYNNSFIGTKNTNALVLTHLNNDIETAVVGTDHINKNGYGKIGDLYFTLSTNPPTSQLVLSVSSYQSIDASGNPIVLLPVNDTLVIDGTTGFNQLLAGNNQLSIYPNPSSGIITISSTKNIDELKITNVLGQLIYEAQPKQTQFNFELKSEGMYFLTVTSYNETVTKKVVVNR